MATARKSQIFDHTFCEYTFPDGTKMYSQGRHLRGRLVTNVSEAVHGTKGTADPSGRIMAEGNRGVIAASRSTVTSRSSTT